MNPTVPKVGDVRSKTGGTTTYFTKANIPRVKPEVSADTLMNPPQVPELTPPKEIPPPVPSPLVANVQAESDALIQANTAEQQKRKDLLSELGAFGQDGSLSSLFEQKQQEFQIPEQLRQLKDINLQLADANTASDLTKTRIEGAAGQTLGQAQREVTQEDRENAVRNSGLAARAAVLQGNIETATALAKDTVDLAFKDRQIEQQNLITQLQEYGAIADEQTKQLVDKAIREEEQKAADLKYLKDATATAIVSGASSAEVAQLTDPTVDDATKLALAQSITARGANQMRDLDLGIKQAQYNKLTAPETPAAPDLKNFGTEAAPNWKQYNGATGEWEDVAGIDANGNIEAQKLSESQNNLRRLSTLANETNKLAGASGLGLFNRAATYFTGDSKYARLSNNVDTLKTNLLTLNTDPAIKKFFGPQMSNRDTELMVSAGSTLNAEKQSADDMRKELAEYQDFIGRAQGWTYLGTGQPLTVTLIDPRTKEQQEVTVNYETLSQAVQDGLQVKF